MKYTTVNHIPKMKTAFIFLKCNWVFLLLGAVFILSGCSNSSSSDQTYHGQIVPLSELVLKQSTDCTDLKSYIKQSLIKQYTRLPRYQYCSTPIPVDSGTASSAGSTNATAGASSPSSPAPTGVSDTNNQEAGVNEGDIVKNDTLGNVYILSGRHLIIAKGFPPQDLTTLKQIDLGARGLSLFLDRDNKRLVVIAREQTPYYITDPVPLAADAIVPPVSDPAYTIAIFLDVSDPANPKLLEQLQLKGYFREGRRINNRLHLVSSYYLQQASLYSDPEFQTLQAQFWNAVHDAACAGGGTTGEVGDKVASDPAVKAAKANLSTKISAVVDAMNPTDILPDALRDNNGTLEPVPYLSCQDIHHPSVDMSLGLQIVSSVDTDGNNLSAAGVVNNAWITYASTNSLYLADTSYSWWWNSPTLQPPSSQTAIYKFDISSGKPRYVATGRVDGYAKDQFSFSEYNGILRVTTTQNDSYIKSMDSSGMPVWESYRNNHLYELQDNSAGKLNVVGQVKDFAKGETIQSARFFGDKGFVVTFRYIDPLFAFDLSDPRNPSLAGEIKLPGYASYIHAYDDNHLITIGRAGNATGTGIGSGMQLQLIDISNISKPVLMHTYTPATDAGWSWSAAEYDHKAFTLYKSDQANVLAIPMMVTPDYSSQVFNGIMAFDVTLDGGFTELGRVDHTDIAKDYYCSSSSSLLPAYDSYCTNGWYVWWAAPRRSVVMTDPNNVYLYTISDVGMKVNATSDLKNTINKITFPSQPYPWWYFGAGVSSGTVSSGGSSTASGGTAPAPTPLPAPTPATSTSTVTVGAPPP